MSSNYSSDQENSDDSSSSSSLDNDELLNTFSNFCHTCVGWAGIISDNASKAKYLIQHDVQRDQGQNAWFRILTDPFTEPSCIDKNLVLWQCLQLGQLQFNEIFGDLDHYQCGFSAKQSISWGIIRRRIRISQIQPERHE